MSDPDVVASFEPGPGRCHLVLAFDDLEAHVRRQVDRLAMHAWLKRVPVHGLVFEVETGRLREVV